MTTRYVFITGGVVSVGPVFVTGLVVSMGSLPWEMAVVPSAAVTASSMDAPVRAVFLSTVPEFGENSEEVRYAKIGWSS